MKTCIIGKDKKDRPSFNDVTLLSKLGIPVSNIKLDNDGHWTLTLPEQLKTSPIPGTSTIQVTYENKAVFYLDPKEGIYELYLNTENIADLEQAGKLPTQLEDTKKSLKEYKNEMENEPQYNKIIEKYDTFSQKYIRKLKADLRKFENPEQPGSYLKKDMTQLDELCLDKLNIMNEAIKNLHRKDLTASKNVKACNDYLESNLDTLSQRRDSWWVGLAKIILSAGIIVPYRYYCKDLVTTGAKGFRLFNKDYERLQNKRDTKTTPGNQRSDKKRPPFK